MTPIEQTIAQLERWIESIHRERDGHAQLMAEERASAIQRAFSAARLGRLDGELASAQDLLGSQQALRLRPELLLDERPRAMLKVAWRGERERKRA